jgi:hypothetical protein
VKRLGRLGGETLSTHSAVRAASAASGEASARDAQIGQGKEAPRLSVEELKLDLDPARREIG